MLRIWRIWREHWHEFRKCRKYGTLILAESIRREAEELAHLAELAGRSIPLSEHDARHLAGLAAEMRRLAILCLQPKFDRVPADRRLTLHRSLNDAREKLLASLQKAGAASEKQQ